MWTTWKPPTMGGSERAETGSSGKGVPMSMDTIGDMPTVQADAFIGGARMTVNNVRAFQDGVDTRVTIEFDRDLRVRVSYLWT
jgi:hypothetical protein